MDFSEKTSFFSQPVKIKYNMCFHSMVPGEKLTVAWMLDLNSFK